jgi:hypothetical protein
MFEGQMAAFRSQMDEAECLYQGNEISEGNASVSGLEQKGIEFGGFDHLRFPSSQMLELSQQVGDPFPGPIYNTPHTSLVPLWANHLGARPNPKQFERRC